MASLPWEQFEEGAFLVQHVWSTSAEKSGDMVNLVCEKV